MTNSGWSSSTQEPVPAPGKNPSVDRALAEDVDRSRRRCSTLIRDVGVARDEDVHVTEAVLDPGGDRGCEIADVDAPVRSTVMSPAPPR